MYSILDRPVCQHVVLQAISAVTHHGGHSVRLSIAKKASVFIRLIEEQPSDPKIAELCIVILTHAALSIIAADRIPTQAEKEQAKIAELLAIFVENIKKPTASLLLLEHAHEFLCTAAQNCSEEFRKFPPAISWLVAATRSKSPLNRVDAILGVLRVYSYAERGGTNLDIFGLMGCLERTGGRLPDHIIDLLGDHVLTCDSVLVLSTQKKFQAAIMQVMQNRDMYELGVKFAQIILVTEYSIAEGILHAENPRTGERVEANLGLPFTYYVDALPHCARTLRARSDDARHADMADILQLKFFMLRSRVTEAHALARRAIERNPRQAFFYYALTNRASPEEGLKIARKGLRRCNPSEMTGYVEFGLRFLAAEHAAQLGFDRISGRTQIGIQSEEEENKRWGEGLAFLTSAYEDLKVFINRASPDTRNMRSALYWYTLVLFALKGPEINDSLEEIHVCPLTIFIHASNIDKSY